MNATETVTVDLADRRYDIVVGDDVFARAGALMAPVLRQKRVIIITDETVARLHLDTLKASLAKAGLTVTRRTGVSYNPLADRWSRSAEMDVNYMVVAEKPAA